MCIHCPRADRYSGPLEIASRIDQQELERLSSHLGLRRPIQIERTPIRGDRNYSDDAYYGVKGEHVPAPDRHIVRIHPYYVWETPQEGNSILLHELRHAYQCEREGPDSRIKYNLLNAIVGSSTSSPHDPRRSGRPRSRSEGRMSEN